MNIDLRNLATAGVRGLRPYQPGKPTSELQRELGLDEIVKLASNENPSGPGRLALSAAREALAEGARYPDGSGFTLKRKLAGRLGVAPECLTLGNGSSEVLEMLARAVLDADHDAVYSSYAFAVYPLATRAVGARGVVAASRGFGDDLDTMRGALGPRSRVVFIANPNNPTGTWLARDAIEAFLDAVPADLLVVIDEAYFEYPEVTGYASCIDLIERFPNLIVTRTFSKVYGLAGLRVGYGVSDPRIAELLNRVRQPFNVNAVALAAAEAALDDTEHLSLSLEVNRTGLTQLTTGLAALGLEYIPSVANFVTVRVPRPATEVYADLLRAGVIVRPMAGYGLPEHLRVTVGVERENRRFLDALGALLAPASA